MTTTRPDRRRRQWTSRTLLHRRLPSGRSRRPLGRLPRCHAYTLWRVQWSPPPSPPRRAAAMVQRPPYAALRLLLPPRRHPPPLLPRSRPSLRAAAGESHAAAPTPGRPHTTTKSCWPPYRCQMRTAGAIAAIARAGRSIGRARRAGAAIRAEQFDARAGPRQRDAAHGALAARSPASGAGLGVVMRDRSFVLVSNLQYKARYLTAIHLSTYTQRLLARRACSLLPAATAFDREPRRRSTGSPSPRRAVSSRRH